MGRWTPRLDHQRVRLALAASRRDADHPGPEGLRTPASGPNATPDRAAEGCALTYLGGTDRVLAGSRAACGRDVPGLSRRATCRTASPATTSRDVRRPQLDAHFVDYMGEAFKPLGVYVNFWQPTLPAGGERSYRVTVINDSYEPVRGRLELGWQSQSGGPAAGSVQGPRDLDFTIPALGRIIVNPTLATPVAPGEYILTAKASCEGAAWSPTVSRRNVAVRK